MAFQRIGVELVLEGVGSFTSQIENVNKSLGNMGSAAQSASGGLSGMISGALHPFTSALGDIWKITGGVLLRDAILGIGNAIRGMVSDAVSAVSVFQQLTIQLESLAARDLARRTGIEMAEALKQVGPAAQETLAWLRTLAVTTPFTVESIAHTLAQAQAYGLTLDVAKKLTSATIDFASGMGLSNESMGRISYNLGQVRTIGKVSARDIRDLSNSFVGYGDILKGMVTDLNALTPRMKINDKALDAWLRTGGKGPYTFQEIAKYLGITADEAKRLAKEGKLAGEFFIQGFINMADKDFRGAAARMARTMQGVAGNIKDFFQSVLGGLVLGPIGEKIAGGLADLLEGLMSEENIAQFTNMGKVLLGGFERIYATIQGQLLPAFEKLGKALGLKPISFEDIFAGIGEVATTISNVIGGISKLVDWIGTMLPGAIQEGQKFLAPFLSFLYDMGLWWGKYGPTIIEQAAKIFGSFGPLVAKVKKDLTPLISEVLTKISLWFGENGPTIVKALSNIADFVKGNLVPGILAAWAFIKPALMGLIDIILGLADIVISVLAGDWKGAWEAIVGIMEGAWATISNLALGLATLVSNIFGGMNIEELQQVWIDLFMNLGLIIALAFQNYIAIPIATFFSGLWAEISTTFIAAWAEIVAYFEEIYTFWLVFFETTGTIISGAFEEYIALPVKNLWNNIKEAFGKAYEEVIKALKEDLFGNIKKAFESAWGEFKGLGVSVIEGIKAGVMERASALVAEVIAAVKAALAAAKKALGIESPSKAFAKIGGFAMEGMTEGIEDESKEVMRATKKMGKETVSAMRKALRAHSPSGEFFDLGTDIGTGLTTGVQASTDFLTQELNEMVDAWSNAAIMNRPGGGGGPGPGGGGNVPDMMPSGPSTNNYYNFSIANNYSPGMSPVPIYDDLFLMLAMARA